MIRRSALVSYSERTYPAEHVWFEIPAALEPAATRSASPWLAAMLPLAVTLQSRLILEHQVDDQLLSSTGPLMGLWNSWYPELTPVQVEVEAAPIRPPHRPPERKTAQLFSGGVDSFYTLFSAEENDDLRIDELLFIHGFDFSIHKLCTSEVVFDSLNRVASSMGKRLIPIATNLRETRFQEVNWTYVGYGCALAAAALILEPRFERVLIASGMHPGFESRSGSHFEIDSHFSTRSTSFVHHGFETGRTDKLEYLAKRPLAFQNLRVCFSSDTGGNCGRCMKCLIVMSMLEVMGALPNTRAFPGHQLDLDRIRRVYLARGTVVWSLIRKYALENDRPDVARAVDGAIRRTAWIDRWLLLGWVRWARDRYRHDPVMRLITRLPRRLMFGAGRWFNRYLP